jgi:hypothetical protein
MSEKILKGATYTADPTIYYERALEVQKKKIDNQAIELARMNMVYLREVRGTKILDAVKFLISVVTNKLK